MMRYWDGQHWTDKVSDAASDPVQTDSEAHTWESARMPQSLATQENNNPWRWIRVSVVLAIIAVIVLCGVGGLVLYNRHRTPTPSAFADSSLTAPSVITDTPTTTPWSVITDTPTTTPWFTPGYFQGTGTSSEFAYKFSAPSTFQCQGTNFLSTPVACWQLVVITRLGCPNGLDVGMNVDATGNTVIGRASGSLNVDLAAGDRAIVQIDATQSFPPGITSSVPDISCAT